MANMTTDEEFHKQFGEELYGRIFSLLYGDITADDITIDDVHHHDRINCTFTGWFERDGVEWYFSGEDGNNNGSVINEYGLTVIEQQHTITERFYAPRIPYGATPEEKARINMNFELKSQSGEYREMERKMNYDMYFSPTELINRHYRQWGESRGLEIQYREIQVG